MRYTIEEFEAALKIDEDDLNSSLVEQPSLYWWVGKRLVDEQSKRDAVKSDLEQKEIEESFEFRERSEEDGRKITEKMVQEEVAYDKKVKLLRRSLLKANGCVAEWSRMEMAVAMRSKILTSLVHLRNTEYFSSSDRGGKDFREATHVAQREAISVRRRR